MVEPEPNAVDPELEVDSIEESVENVEHDEGYDVDVEPSNDVEMDPATDAKTVLGWNPKVGFEKLVKKMVDQDVEMVNTEK
ncbi:hypothetical protein RIF29_33386 [Crotalaria pallida]|uniref:Uncharacterized protein n=1 Tax=Crotalaria pallida TaxID=3830 RepID=A0AAN9HSR1_CROPI